jgi:hypothetical protein
MLYVQVVDGPNDGLKIEVKGESSVTVGRAAEATCAFSHDEQMSEIHFSLRFSEDSLLLNDLSEGRTTLVNGRPEEAAVLRAGDRIMAGQTTFLVVDSEEIPAPAELRVGGWLFEAIPEGWHAVNGVGLVLAPGAPFRASMSAVEEPLPDGQTLPDYIKTQMDQVLAQVKDAETTDAGETRMPGADRAMEIDVFSPAPNGERVGQHQIYATKGDVVGVFTISLLESQVDQLGEAIGAVVKALSFYRE